MSQNYILYLPTYKQLVYIKHVVTNIKIYYLTFSMSNKVNKVTLK